MGTQFSQLPVVFLSYDEPYADIHWEMLRRRLPGAHRIHGVKGFDAAHKAAADLAKGQDFITVDADCIALEAFWSVYLDARPAHFKDHVLSWRSFNVCNGLSYGNGGLKLWTSDFATNMVTHEAASSEGKAVVDFCWDKKYTQLKPVFSLTDITSSAYHAWRAGYREGVKMPLVEGKPPPDANSIESFSYATCIQRLKQWVAVGRDRGFGSWAMLGALTGFCEVHVFRSVPLESVMDYDWFLTHWSVWQDKLSTSPVDLPKDPFVIPYMRVIIDNMLQDCLARTDIHFPTFGPKQSFLIKQFLTPVMSDNPYEEESWSLVPW